MAKCGCGAALRPFWVWLDDERDDLMHVTDRHRDAPRGADQIQAVSATDAAIAWDKKHEPEHDIVGARGRLRTGRCARRPR